MSEKLHLTSCLNGQKTVGFLLVPRLFSQPFFAA
jgi:hypothetical protein